MDRGASCQHEGGPGTWVVRSVAAVVRRKVLGFIFKSDQEPATMDLPHLVAAELESSQEVIMEASPVN